MASKTIFSSTAAEEIRNSYVWYENHSKGLGDRFVNFIDLSLDMVKLNPSGFPVKK
jgi:hypothetical protein